MGGKSELIEQALKLVSKKIGSGNPEKQALRLYHGTTVPPYSEIDPTKGEFGIHLGTPEQANSFATPYDEGPIANHSRVIPLDVSVQNPLRLVDYGRWDADVVYSQLSDRGITKFDEDLMDKLANSPHDPINHQAVQKIINDAGYDGIVYLNRREGVPSDIPDYLLDDYGDELDIPDDVFKRHMPGASDSYIVWDKNKMKSPFGEGGGNSGYSNGGSVREGYQTKGRVVGDVVEQALKLVTGEGDEAAKAGIRAYHVSPHDFDRFDLSKIGTGEGNQAYGHGLYFAESPKVSGQGGDYWRQFWNKMKSGPEQSAASALWASKFDRDKAAESLEKSVQYHRDQAAPGRYGNGPDVELGNQLLADDYQKALEMLQSGQIVGPRTYEVEISADPNTFLDWDREVANQSPEVSKILKKLAAEDAAKYGEGGGLDYYIGDPESYSGESFYRYLGSQLTPTEASAVLREAGIPGIKYLDAGSRGKGVAQVQVMYKGKPHGDPIPVHAWNQIDQLTKDYKAKGYDVEVQDLGTRNYVVFDDKLISIIRKYGIAGASAMLGYNLMEQLDSKQALAATMADQDYKAGQLSSETDDIDDALRVAKDVGGGIGPVFMTDAKGISYDIKGNIIPPEVTGPNPARSEATPEQVGQRAAQDPATFDALMERYAVPDQDIARYEATKAEVAKQPYETQQMTHVGAPPMRDVKVDMPLFGGEQKITQAPYNVASGLSGMAQTAYDFKTAPLYMTPWTAPIGAGLDVAEGVATGDPLQASLAALGAPGKYAKAAIIGGSNYLMSPAEAQAGPARWFSRAMEVARDIPMNKMTGEQALAMLRKGTSPEELKWTGTDVFLQGKPQVTKQELVDYLNKNRVQTKEIVLGGTNKPTRLENIDIIDIPAEIRDRHPEVYRLSNRVEELRDELNKLRSMPDQSGLDYYDNFRAVSQEFSNSQAKLMQAKEALRKEYAESIGGLGVSTKYGPDSVHGETLTTPGGKNYSENLYALPQKDIYTPFVEQMRKDVWEMNFTEAMKEGFGEERAKNFADKFNDLPPDKLAKFLGKEEELKSVFEAQKSFGPQYTGGHWGDISPDVLFHTRTSELIYEPPGANRPYRVHSVEEAQSDPGQAGRKRGFKDQKAMAEVARLTQQTQDLRSKLKSEQARLYAEHQKRIAPYVEERVRYERDLLEKYKKGEISLGDMNRLAESYGSPEPEITGQYRAATYQVLNPIMDKIAANEAEINRIGSKIGEIPMMPFISSTEAWTDRAIKHELDKAFDNGSDYFSWTPGEAQAERYDLSRHIGKIDYNPDDGSLIAYNPEGKMVINTSVNDPSELDEYVGEELAKKLRAEEESRRSSINEYDVEKDEETGEWSVSLYGEPSYDYNGEPLLFRSKGEAKDYLNELMANEFANQPVTLSGLDIKTGGEGMVGYYDKIFLKRVQDVIKKATGIKPNIEVIEVQTANGPRKQLGIRLTDEMREKARFSDFNKGGRVTGGNTYDNDSSVAHALALTSEY